MSERRRRELNEFRAVQQRLQDAREKEKKGESDAETQQAETDRTEQQEEIPRAPRGAATRMVLQEDT